MKIEILCQKGIKVDNEFIMFGDTIDVANNILGKPETFNNTDFFYEDSSIAIYLENGVIDEIELSPEPNQNIEVYIDDLEIFKCERETFYDFLIKKNNAPFERDSVGTITAANLCLAFGEDITQEDIDEMIADAKADGIYEEMKETIDTDIYRLHHLDSICLSH